MATKRLRLKDVAVSVFQTIANDTELLELLEVPSRNMKDIRYQIVEDKYPSDLIIDNLSRLCVYELPPSKSLYSPVEKSIIQIDIYVTTENNKIDRRILLIVNRLFQLFHNKQVDGSLVEYYTRLPNLPTDNKEWAKYGIQFSYNNFII